MIQVEDMLRTLESKRLIEDHKAKDALMHSDAEAAREHDLRSGMLHELISDLRERRDRFQQGTGFTRK